MDNMEQYRFLSNGYLALTGVDDSQEFHNTIRSMKIMGFHDEEITGEQLIYFGGKFEILKFSLFSAIFRVVSAVLHFGNLDFQQEKKSDQAMLPDDRGSLLVPDKCF